MLFIRYSFDPGATILIQFIQKTPEYYSKVFALSVCRSIVLLLMLPIIVTELNDFSAELNLI